MGIWLEGFEFGVLLAVLPPGFLDSSFRWNDEWGGQE